MVRDKSSGDPTVVAFEPSPDLAARLRRVRRQRAINRDGRRHLWDRSVGYELFSDDRSALGPALVQRLPAADIISLNWIPGFVDIGSFFRGFSPNARLVWRLPDMFPFTGGCHYDGGCGRYAESCGNCPQLASNGNADLSRRIWQRKKDAYDRLARDQLQLVAVSSLQVEEVRRSSLLGRFPVTMIPACVDVATFTPRPKVAVRESLGLPPHRLIVLMVADTLTRRAKGASLLAAAIGLLDRDHRPLVMTVGRNAPEFAAEFDHLHWGHVSDDRLLALLYSAADLLAFPSLQEAGGQTVLEALACGLPVVGFDSGGVRAAIRPGVTGFIAEAKTSEALAAALKIALEDVERLHALSRACRETAETQFSVELAAWRYRELYGSLLAGNERRTGTPAFPPGPGN